MEGEAQGWGSKVLQIAQGRGIRVALASVAALPKRYDGRIWPAPSLSTDWLVQKHVKNRLHSVYFRQLLGLDGWIMTILI